MLFRSKEFLKFVKTLDHNNLTKDQQTFFNFFYKALLYSRYGRESHMMTFEIKDVLSKELKQVGGDGFLW